MFNKAFYSILMLLLLASCGEQEFSAKKINDTTTTDPILNDSRRTCSNYTVVKPKVDFLFLWDNTGSQTFVTNAVKTALNNTITQVSSDFDYHILMAPLVGNSSSTNYLVTENDDLNSLPGNVVRIGQSDAASRMSNVSNAPSGSNRENGLERIKQILNQYHGTNIFRTGSNLIVVLMSNGDDHSFVNGSVETGPDRENYLVNQVNALTCLRGNTTKSCSGLTYNFQQMRMISIVAHGSCQPGYRMGDVYLDASSRIYNEPYSNSNLNHTDQTGKNNFNIKSGVSNYKDAFDICSGNFNHIFDGVNSAIKLAIVKNVYNYWPITNSTRAFDENRITAIKSTGEVLQPSTTNGYEVVPGYVTLNTREFPSPGEPFTGRLLKLNGSAKVTYPECLTVNTVTPTEFYGYIQLHSRPLESSIKVYINGALAPASAWTYIGYRNSQNVKVDSPNNFQNPGYPALNKSGYFIKIIDKNYIFSNNTTVTVQYDPSST